jgi:hypothetical protein
LRRRPFFYTVALAAVLVYFPARGHPRRRRPDGIVQASAQQICVRLIIDWGGPPPVTVGLKLQGAFKEKSDEAMPYL